MSRPDGSSDDSRKKINPSTTIVVAATGDTARRAIAHCAGSSMNVAINAPVVNASILVGSSTYTAVEGPNVDTSQSLSTATTTMIATHSCARVLRSIMKTMTGHRT